MSALRLRLLLGDHTARDAERLALAAGVEMTSFRGTHNAFGDRAEELRFDEMMRSAIDEAIVRAKRDAAAPQDTDRLSD